MGGMHFPIDGEVVSWDKFPVKEIVKRGWVKGFNPEIQAEEIMRELASQACAHSYFADQNRACFRQGTRRNENDDSYSVDVWILRVLGQAETIEAKVKFNQNILDKDFICQGGLFKCSKRWTLKG